MLNDLKINVGVCALVIFLSVGAMGNTWQMSLATAMLLIAFSAMMSMTISYRLEKSLIA